MRTISWSVGLLFLLSACSVEPEPIHYGEDNCVHCAMTIMDHRYGTEIVTDKGKVYKFDSIECLIEFMDDRKEGEEDFPLILFTSYDQPGRLVDARQSYVLQSKNLPSPMGMYLTAFDDEPAAMNYRDQYSGNVYSWEGLNENFQVMRLKGVDHKNE